MTWEKNEMRRNADARHQLHRGQASHRPLSKDYELVALAGETAFAKWIGAEVDRTLRPGGTKKGNFVLNGHPVNVYTARIPNHLLVERGKANVHIYVLAGYSEHTGEATLLGWADQRMVLAAPIKDTGKRGVWSHTIPQYLLRPMETLRKVLKPEPEQIPLL